MLGFAVIVFLAWIILNTVCIFGVLGRVEKLEDWRRKKESE